MRMASRVSKTGRGRACYEAAVLTQLMIAWLVVNMLTACVYAYDKWQAKRGGGRVRERTLLGLAAVGGAVGALGAMRLVRHKTRKPAFRVGVPALLVLQAGAVGAALYARYGA
jgi:uncharacterized membrane protein YsdA (DUF1294 family)